MLLRLNSSQYSDPALYRESSRPHLACSFLDVQRAMKGLGF